MVECGKKLFRGVIEEAGRFKMDDKRKRHKQEAVRDQSANEQM